MCTTWARKISAWSCMHCSLRRHSERILSGSCTANRWSAYGPGCGGCWVRTPAGVGAAAHYADFTVSLDGLPAAHLRVLLDGLPVFEPDGLLLAGGYAFRAHEILHRPSQDLDFAARDDTPLPEIAAHVQRAFQRAGYSVRLVEATSLRYARLVLQLPGSDEELEMDLRVLEAHGRADPLQARRKEGPRIGLWDLWLWRAAVLLVTVRVLAGAQCGAYLGRTA